MPTIFLPVSPMHISPFGLLCMGSGCVGASLCLLVGRPHQARLRAWPGRVCAAASLAFGSWFLQASVLSSGPLHSPSSARTHCFFFLALCKN